jgi:hypothetical protein
MNRKQLAVVAATVFFAPTGAVCGRQAQPQNPPAALQSQPVSQDPETAARAAERKKRFDEAKQRLEADGRAQTPPCTEGKPTLYISPTEASMLVGETRTFSLFDTDGHKLTATAEWEVSSSYLAGIKPGPEPMITAKNEGTFTVTARVDTRTAEAKVKVYPGQVLPIGAVIWKAAPVPCGKNSGISKSVQAVPH